MWSAVVVEIFKLNRMWLGNKEAKDLLSAVAPFYARSSFNDMDSGRQSPDDLRELRKLHAIANKEWDSWVCTQETKWNETDLEFSQRRYFAASKEGHNGQ